jgi:LacI family transcriptional regulator
MKTLTLEEIGKMAGVSRSTVSRVLNNQANVSEDVRQKVKGIIKDTGFSPNTAARTLVSQKTYVIGLVIPQTVQAFFADPYFARITQGIAQATNQNNYTLSLFLFDTQEVENRLIPLITRPGFIDGLIVQATSENDNVSSRISNGTVPFIFAGRPMGHEEVNYIDVDNIRGAKIAVNHLASLGKKRIGTITGNLEISPGIDRKTGYIEGLKENNLPIDEDLIVEADFTQEGGYQAVEHLLKYKPDALFIASDQMAIGALRRLKELNISVPEDIAIVGYDDLPPAQYADPKLTTIKQPILRFGEAVVSMLMKKMNNVLPLHENNILDVELIIRDSCGGKFN